ncbi:hypothetical protein [Thermococcus aciditolerans]|uniref:hypothetical protein n=1 Tax=Thermococcus aciditolerans TaxID=2598455 RepID=UPI00319DB875
MKLETIEVIFYIEGLGSDKKVLERAMEETAERLKAEKSIRVHDVRVEEIIEDPDNDTLPYSGMIEARISGPLNAVFNTAVRYAPAAVEVLSPPKIEVDAKGLMELLGGLSYAMGQLIDKFGPLAAYPSLEEFPEPQIGYSREEIEEFIVEDRKILYRFVVEVFGDDEETVTRNFAKALAYEGCTINKLVPKVQSEDENGRKYILIAAELLSTFENLIQLTAKYSPVAIAILEPEVVDITAPELQGALADVAGFVYELTMRPLKKRILEKKNTEFKLNP